MVQVRNDRYWSRRAWADRTFVLFCYGVFMQMIQQLRIRI